MKFYVQAAKDGTLSTVGPLADDAPAPVHPRQVVFDSYQETAGKKLDIAQSKFTPEEVPPDSPPEPVNVPDVGKR